MESPSLGHDSWDFPAELGSAWKVGKAEKVMNNIQTRQTPHKLAEIMIELNHFLQQVCKHPHASAWCAVAENVPTTRDCTDVRDNGDTNQ